MGGEDAKDDAKRSKDSKDEAAQPAAVVAAAAPDAKVTPLSCNMFWICSQGEPRFVLLSQPSLNCPPFMSVPTCRWCLYRSPPLWLQSPLSLRQPRPRRRPQRRLRRRLQRRRPRPPRLRSLHRRLPLKPRRRELTWRWRRRSRRLARRLLAARRPPQRGGAAAAAAAAAAVVGRCSPACPFCAGCGQPEQPVGTCFLFLLQSAVPLFRLDHCVHLHSQNLLCAK